MNKKNRKLISIVIATIAAGIPVFTATAHSLNFSDPVFLLLWCFLGIIGAFGTYLYYNLEIRDIIGTFIVGYMLAVILRFVSDIVVNNFAHNDLSLALFYAMGVGAAAGWIGSGLWILLRKSKRKSK